jgi:ribonuclease PH
MGRAGRAWDEPRAVTLEPGFHRNAEGSVLYRAGGTVVLVTASIADGVPKWMAQPKGGWLTAEYQMHPRASPAARSEREGRGKPVRGRTSEIERLVGRSLRAAVALGAIGERTITVDCDVLEADGGTRTASITAGWVATALALAKVGLLGTLREQIAAVSVGWVDDALLLDLDYREDSRARVDMNVVATARGALVEVQATAEGLPLPRAQYEPMLDAALGGVRALGETQRRALALAGMDPAVCARLTS